MIDEVQDKCKLYLNLWYADDGTLIGPIAQISRAAEILQKTGVGLGYHLEVKKSKLWWPSVTMSKL